MHWQNVCEVSLSSKIAWQGVKRSASIDAWRIFCSTVNSRATLTPFYCSISPDQRHNRSDETGLRIMLTELTDHGIIAAKNLDDGRHLFIPHDLPVLKQILRFKPDAD